MIAPDLGQIAALEMRSQGLQPDFSAAALHEAQGHAASIPATGGHSGVSSHADDNDNIDDIDNIDDLRSRLWFSIDNNDTLDLDQLSWAQALDGGSIRLAVAVADVDARVKRAGAVDAHAAHNTTSVYTAAGVFPMLPPLLSNDLTSLHEGQDRLAVVVDMTIGADGAVLDSRLQRAWVRNAAKLNYDSVSDWLDGRSPAPAAVAASSELQIQLQLHDRVATSLRRWRHSRGALNVSTVQARPVFDDSGRLVDLRADHKNRAKDLIADLMIATNGATARFLAQRGQPSLRRVLQQPRRWDRLVQLAAAQGTALPPLPDALALDRFLTLRRAAAPAAFEDLSLAVVKLLGSGAYAAAAGEASAAPAGHFGLAINDYAHSTAPNRRFVDLVTQRLVKATLAGQAAPYLMAELEKIAQHCTLQEDKASTVERRVLKAAAAWLLQGRLGETFDAVVTGVAPKGTFVRIHSPLVEGRVLRGFAGLDVGDTLRVRLASVDIDQRFIDFERA